MNISWRRVLCIGAMILLLTAACASMRTLHVWKDPAYSQKLGKTLILFVAENEYIRNHFENVLAARLGDSGIDASPSNKVIPHLGAKPDREALVAKVTELGFENVLVARAVAKEEYSHLISGGDYAIPTGYYAGWNSFYNDSFAMVAMPGAAYDAEYYTIVTNVYAVSGERLLWSYLSRVRVETSKQAVVNPFIEKLVEQLRRSELI